MSHLNASHVTPEVIRRIKQNHHQLFPCSDAKGSPQWSLPKHVWLNAGVPESAFAGKGCGQFQASVSKKKIKEAFKVQKAKVAA